MPEERLVICPECKFPNMPGATACLTCKASLVRRSSSNARTTRYGPAGAAAAAGLGPGTQPDANLRPRGFVPAMSDTPTRPFVRPRGGLLEPADPLADGARAAADELARGPDVPIVGWLRCGSLPPIALGPKRSVTMGRAQDCDLILPHSTVSRVHAVVRVLGRQLVLEDRSSYGSYLNGKPVTSSSLAVGDRIGIGPYEVRVLGPGPDGLESGTGESEDHTQPLDFAAFRQVPGDAELLGTLDRPGALFQILQTIELNGKSGILKVTSGHLAGELALWEGRPLFAHLGELRDDEAVLAMAGLRSGSFCLWGAEVDPASARMTTSLTRLMLEASRQLDETVRDESSAEHRPLSTDQTHPPEG